MRGALAIPKKGIVASKIVAEDSSEDISLKIKQAVEIGKDCIDELREIFPEIPKNVKYRRSKSWSIYWYVTFYLSIPVISNAHKYADEKSEGGEYNSDFYWEYIHDFEGACKEVTEKFSNDDFHLHVSRNNDTPYGTWDQATLEVYILK